MPGKFNLEELLHDAEDCPRLTDWEEGFLASLRGKLAQYGDRMSLFDKQMLALRKVEEKVYKV